LITLFCNLLPNAFVFVLVVGSVWKLMNLKVEIDC
jgi:hypothetical protein